MNFKKASLIIFIVLGLLLISSVSASDLSVEGNNLTDNYLDDSLAGNEKVLYVDGVNGNDANNGSSSGSSLKSMGHALDFVEDAYTINLADGIYSNSANTRLTIDKSITIIGSNNTVFDGQGRDYIFIISNNAEVTFKNIKFINAYKSPVSYSNSYDDSVYGAALDIRDASVTLDNCQFMDNVLFYGTVDKYIYGGAISNLGNLTILNSYFENNTALSTSGLFSYGGSVYSKGRLYVNNSIFNKSNSVDFGYGAGIANDGQATIENSIITDSRALHECKGSAIYNAGDLILLNSIIENNYIERANFNYIYGVIYNSGNFVARGNVFRNNSANYESPIPSYKGSPNIYNVGNLNLTYNAFIDNAIFDGISRDVYFNGGECIDLNYNWWNTNENPYNDGLRININFVNSWLMFALTPEYSKLDIGQTAIITASWTGSDNLMPQIGLFPIFDVTFTTSYGYELDKQLINGVSYFTFDYSQNKGSFIVSANVGDFNQSVIVDVGKLEAYLHVVNNDTITFSDTLEIEIDVTGEGGGMPTGWASVIIGNKIYEVNLTAGRADLNISNLLPGNYTLNVIYQGDGDYFKSFFNRTVTIKKQSVDLSLSIPEIKIGERGSVIVTLLPKGVQGQAILFVDGVRKKVVYLYNGNTTISLNNFGEGEYNITLQFVETDYYYSSNVSGILKVTKYDSSLSVSAHDVHVGENATVIINVTPNTLRGEAILNINGVNNTIFLENSTTCINLFGLNAGTYNVEVMFEGDSKYYSSSDSTSFKVFKTQTSLDVTVREDEKNLNGTIAVNINPSRCTGVIGVYVNYHHYTANIVSGKAKFNVKFDKGTNYIFVYYEGNDIYYDSSWNTTIGVADEFVFMGENSTGWNYNDFNYSVRLLEINGIPMPNRVVSIEFADNKFSVTTNDDGYAYFPLNLPTGEYNITATYKNATIDNVLAVKDIHFNLTTCDIVYEDLEVINVSFDKGISGKVNIAIDGVLNGTIEIVNNSAVYNLSGLDVGKYVVKAIYLNDYYVSEETTGNFTVSKANLVLNVTADDVVYTADQIITVSNLKNATGNLTFSVNGEEYSKEIKNSEVILNLSKLPTGEYPLVISYLGDKNYRDLNFTTVFYVKEKSSDVILTVNNAVYGENITVSAYLDKNATGVVHFAVAGLSKDIKIVDGVANWTFSGLDVGSYRITANYLGDHYYISSANATTFSISKANSQINLYVGEVVLNENIRIYAYLSPNATGKVSFSMLGYYSPRNKAIVNSTAMWYISPLNTGEYAVIATYAGDDNYYGSNTTYMLQVTQKRATLTVEIYDVGLNDRVTAKISLVSGDELLTGRISLRVGEKSYSVLVNNGKATFVIGKLEEGNYTYQASYDGDENYSRSSCGGKFIVREALLDVNLTASNVVKYYKGSKQLVVYLMSSSGKAIAGETLHIAINGKEYSAITDNSGKASVDLNLVSGEYVASIRFDETERYNSASTNASITIMPTVEGIDLIKIYGSGSQYFAIFCDSNGKVLGNTKVSFKIGKNSITVKTLPNGIARLNINLNPGTYKIVATNHVTGEKAVNTIKVFKRLAGNRNVVQYYGGGKYYKVRAFADDGKAVGAGVIIKIRINGKTYNVKTNRYGYALFKINLKPKIYVITATYKGYKVSNVINVKSTIITKNILKKKSQSTTFKAKLVNSKGKILKSKKIVFKFLGKNYIAKTNRYGIASIAVKSSLKVGKYYIITRYGSLSIRNMITVRN